MDQTQVDRIERDAQYIWRIFKVSIQEKQWLVPMLSHRYQQALEILEILSVKGQSYEDLSEATGLHINTVKQYVLAMERGGIPLTIGKYVAVASTGRLQNIFELGEE